MNSESLANLFTGLLIGILLGGVAVKAFLHQTDRKLITECDKSSYTSQQLVRPDGPFIYTFCLKGQNFATVIARSGVAVTEY